MKVLLTGAFGNVGLSTLEELIKRGYDIKVFDVFNRRNHKIAKKYRDEVVIIWGDLRNSKDVEKAVDGQDVIIHVGAVIPPLADRKPEFAESVNVGGTKNIIAAMEKQTEKPKLIFTSSVAVYGDRVKSPLIKPSDPLNPNPHDEYAKQKIRCEELVRNSGLEWVTFRLTYITSVKKLLLDPLLFDMPLDTSIEICDTRDVGLALANAVEHDGIWGETMHIAGGEKCRVIYRDYINDMMEIFGLGRGFLPEAAFSKSGFHCGFMTTEKSQKYLNYQRHTLEDFYNDVKKKVGIKRYFFIMFKPIIRRYLLRQSPHYKTYLKNH